MPSAQKDGMRIRDFQFKRLNGLKIMFACPLDVAQWSYLLIIHFTDFSFLLYWKNTTFTLVNYVVTHTQTIGLQVYHSSLHFSYLFKLKR